jgi:hypothetical protein
VGELLDAALRLCEQVDQLEAMAVAQRLGDAGEDAVELVFEGALFDGVESYGSCPLR